MQVSSSIADGSPKYKLRSDANGGNTGFPSFRLGDTVSTSSAVERTDSAAPLRFTLDPSKWKREHFIKSQALRPTLISPPAPEDDDSASTLNSSDAPPIPAMEDLKRDTSSSKNLKRPSPAIPPHSFLPYKRRATSSHFQHEMGGSPLALNPDYLRRVLEVEPRLTEAASILLHMRSEAPVQSPVSQNEEFQPEPCKLPIASISTDEPTSTPSIKILKAQMTQQPPVTATRSVTPAPSGLRLALPDDVHELNSLHCFVRAELLELFALPGADDEVVSGQPAAQKGRIYSGRVGLRCVHCAHLPRRARSGCTMSTFYPKSLSDIYRSVCTWQRIHFRACRHVPPPVREAYWQLKESDRTRGKTRYWVTSARSIGLVDVDSERGGICFESPNPSSQSLP